MKQESKKAGDVRQDGGNLQDLKGQLDAINRSLAVIQFDLDGTILSANENFLTTVGYSLEEVQGKKHRMFVDPAEANSADYQQFWKKLAQGEFFSAQYRRLGRAGREVWIQASYNPIYDEQGRPYKVVKYAYDITDAKLREADARSKLDAIDRSQAVIEFDLQGHVLHANDNFLSVMGYTLDEIRGKHHRLLLAPSESSGRSYEDFWAKLRVGQFDAGKTMQDVVSGAKQVADIISEITAASGEQATSIEQVGTAIGEMGSVSRDSAEAVRRAGQSAAHMDDVARTLSDTVSIFRLPEDMDLQHQYDNARTAGQDRAAA